MMTSADHRYRRKGIPHENELHESSMRADGCPCTRQISKATQRVLFLRGAASSRCARSTETQVRIESSSPAVCRSVGRGQAALCGSRRTKEPLINALVGARSRKISSQCLPTDVRQLASFSDCVPLAVVVFVWFFRCRVSKSRDRLGGARVLVEERMSQR